MRGKKKKTREGVSVTGWKREKEGERVKKGPICYVNVLVDRGKKWTAKLSLDRHG